MVLKKENGRWVDVGTNTPREVEAAMNPQQRVADITSTPLSRARDTSNQSYVGQNMSTQPEPRLVGLQPSATPADVLSAIEQPEEYLNRSPEYREAVEAAERKYEQTQVPQVAALPATRISPEIPQFQTTRPAETEGFTPFQTTPTQLEQELGMSLPEETRNLTREQFEARQQQPMGRAQTEMMSRPAENFTYSKTGEAPTYGMSRLGTPIYTNTQLKLLQKVNPILDRYEQNKIQGQKIMSGDFSIANGVPSAQGLPGTPVSEYENRLEDIRQWTANNTIEYAENNYGELAAQSLGRGVTYGVAGGVAASYTGPGAAVGFTVGFVGGVAHGIYNYFDLADTKEGKKDIREAFTQMKGMLPLLKEQGLVNEYNALLSQLEEVNRMYEKIGEYGQQRNITSLINEAQDVQIKAMELYNIAVEIDGDTQNVIKDVEYKLGTGQGVSEEDLNYAAKNGSSKAADYIKNEEIRKSNQMRLEQQATQQIALVTKAAGMSAEEILKDPEWIKFVSNPDNQGTLAYDVYTDAQTEVKTARETAESRAYAEFREKESREYAEERQLEQRQYEVARENLAARRAAALETESVPSSSLGFGLLRTSGGTQLVNKEDAEALAAGELITGRDELVSVLFPGFTYGQLSNFQKELVRLFGG